MRRILLVEDNPGDVELIRHCLEQVRPEIEIHHCADGEEALRYLDAGQGRPDIILLDWNVPKRNGREVLSRLRNAREGQPIPVVVLSSSESPTDLVGAYGLGAAGYLVKPLLLEELQSQLNKLVDYWFGVVRLPSSVATYRGSA